MQTPDADSFLIAAIRKGDQRAWRQLIERYQGRLLAFAKSRLGLIGEAEDVLQDALLGFVTSLRHYDEARSLETYLFAILRYKIGEHLSKKNRRLEFTTGFDIDNESPTPAGPTVSETPSQTAARREQQLNQEERLARILRRLIEEFRDKGKLEDLQVIELLFYVGLRNRDAGQLLGRDEKAVAGVKFRALGRLREFIEELDADDRRLIEEGELSAETTVARIWRQRRLSCLKRGTIGSYLLDVLEEPWRTYTTFHLETVKCLMCRANLDDLRGASEERIPDAALSERMFQSSVGFLSYRP